MNWLKSSGRFRLCLIAYVPTPAADVAYTPKLRSKVLVLLTITDKVSVAVLVKVSFTI